jgi:hypothetical protein
MKLHIRSHPIAGWDEIRRAGRAWPVKGIDIEVVDEDLDPPAEPGDKVLRIGRNTLEALKGDPRITVNAAGSVDDIPRLKARIRELEADLAASKGERAPGQGDPPVERGPAPDLSPHLRKGEDSDDATLPDSPSAKGRKGK